MPFKSDYKAGEMVLALVTPGAPPGSWQKVRLVPTLRVYLKVMREANWLANTDSPQIRRAFRSALLTSYRLWWISCTGESRQVTRLRIIA